ncbi:MAG: hypothetical protein ACFB2W_00265 [Leptolyngbyaceae cyanobacterium]
MNIQKWWRISNSISFLFLIMIGGMWIYTDKTGKSTSSDDNSGIHRLRNGEDINQYLSSKEDSIQNKNRVPTGVFIQSLRFNNSTEVNFTGYIWQTYDISYTSQYESLEDVPIGFIFPEAVESGSNVEPKYAYSKIKENKVVIGWYFETTLKQKFEYSKYPFDHKTAWIRIWSNNFEKDELLTPDFSSYKDHEERNEFGLDSDIVLGHWELIETFFGYNDKDYTSNFGIFEDDVQTGYPELYFNIVLKRRFLNSFIIQFLPITIIASLTFATLVMITKDPTKESKFGMNTSGVIGVCSGLFFVVLLSQVQIREQFAGTSIVYIEYFYPLMYLALLGVSVNSYLFALPNDSNNQILDWINQDDNVHPKLLFWPLLLGSATLITALVLLPKENGHFQSEQEQTAVEQQEMIEAVDTRFALNEFRHFFNT